MTMRQQIAQFLHRLARRIDDTPTCVRTTIYIDGKALGSSAANASIQWRGTT